MNFWAWFAGFSSFLVFGLFFVGLDLGWVGLNI